MNGGTWIASAFGTSEGRLARDQPLKVARERGAGRSAYASSSSSRRNVRLTLITYPSSSPRGTAAQPSRVRSTLGVRPQQQPYGAG